MLPLRRAFCGCSLETATLFALYITLIPNALYFVATFSDNRMRKYSTSESWYDLMFLSSVLALLNALVSFFALVDVYKKKTSWLTLFILIQIVNCIFSVFFTIEMVRRGSLKLMWEEEINDTITQYRFRGTDEKQKFREYLKSLYPAAEIIVWVIVAITLVLAVYFSMIIYSFMIETKTRLSLPIYAAPMEQGTKHATWEDSPYYHPPPPPPYSAFNNDTPTLPPYNLNG